VSHRYCGRDFSDQDIAQIRRLIAEEPHRTRAELSRLTCRVLNWYKADGGLKDMSARVAMLRMHADGLITLPPPRRTPPAARFSITAQTDPASPLHRPAHTLTSLSLQRVQNRHDSRLWNEYIHRYHYLGYKPLPGAQLRYILLCEAQPIALLGFGAAAWQTAPRDRYIGWNHEQRQRNLPLIVNNARFLLLPWVHSKNLASMLLARVAKVLPQHWQELYGYCPVLLETFVERPRFTGTCYKAANWIYLGQTKGRGKLAAAGKQSVPIKDLWVYPLDRRFREVLTR
jgi:hypothetical protein